MSLLKRINRYAIAGTGTVTTLGGHYEVTGDQIVPIVGLAYEIEEIAMRVDLVIEPNTDINNFSAKTSANSSRYSCRNRRKYENTANNNP